MIKPESLSAEAIKILNARVKDEQSEFYFYISASAWCRLNGYECSARYLEIESHGEEWHYKRLIDFLTRWNVKVDFNIIGEPIKTFVNLQDVFEKAYRMEYDMMEKYNGDCIDLFKEQNVYVLVQDFVRIQNESVCQINDYLQKMYKAKTDDPSLIEFDKSTFGEYRYLGY